MLYDMDIDYTSIGWGYILTPRLRKYLITPLKGAAPLSGSIKNLTIFWKIFLDIRLE